MLSFWVPGQAGTWHPAEIDWLRPIEDLCRFSDLAPAEQDFCLDGQSFGLRVFKTMPRSTWAEPWSHLRSRFPICGSRDLLAWCWDKTSTLSGHAPRTRFTFRFRFLKSHSFSDAFPNQKTRVALVHIPSSDRELADGISKQALIGRRCVSCVCFSMREPDEF